MHVSSSSRVSLRSMKDLSYSTQSSRYARVRSSCLRLFVTKKIPDHEHFLRKIVIQVQPMKQLLPTIGGGVS